MPIKVIFVCLGNICRSPMAEAIFKDLVHKAGLTDEFFINSAGTANYHIDKCPDHRTIQVCKSNDIIIDHQGRQLSVKDLEDYDFVVAMDLENYKNIKSLAKDESQIKKIYLMRNFSEPEQGLIVPDPYYGNQNDFEEVYQILDQSCRALLTHIQAKRGS